jgi:WD40 repeat protein
MRWLTGHRRDVRAVAYTPDGRVVSGGGDGTVRVWDPVTGGCTTDIKTKAPVYAVAASPDGKTVAYAGRYADRAAGENRIHFWDLDADRTAGEHVWRMETGPDGEPESCSIWSLAYSADGVYLAAACRRIGGGNIPDGGGGCWVPLRTRSEGGRLPGDDAYAVAFAPRGHGLAVIRESAAHFLTSPHAAEGVAYPYSVAWSSAVAFVPGADLAAVASGSFLYFVNPERVEKPARVKAGGRLAALAVSPDGRVVLAGIRSGVIEVYETATRRRTTTYDFGVGGLQGLAFAPGGLTFAAAGDKGLVECDVDG